MRLSLALSAIGLLACLACPASGLKTDERVILYPALGRGVSNGWEVRLHGLVYEPERRPVLRRVLRRALGIDDDDLTDRELAVFKERADYFLVDNERGKELLLTVGDRTIHLGTSSANGHFEGLVSFGKGDLPALNRPGTNGGSVSVPARVATQDGHGRELRLEVSVLSDEGLSVISDLDDTIKISDVRNRRALITNTFCRPFQAVPGMAGLYRGWARSGAQFHYVSASPWQLYVPLSDFTRSNGFPAGTFHMKSFRLKDSTFLSLLKSPERYKPAVIEEIFRLFPKRRYVLVGDSGEKDPEVYGALARRHPQRVQGIFIRDVTGEAADSPRYRRAFRDVPAGRWHVFNRPEELEGRPDAIELKSGDLTGFLLRRRSGLPLNGPVGMIARIKICGITSRDDALFAVDAGADALGFMFYPPSPRCVAPEQAAAITRALPPLVAKVGVFVNPDETEVRRAIAECGLDTLQFHGEETPEFCRRFGLKVLKAFRIRDAGSLQAMPAFAEEGWLLDSYVTGQPGGTGERFNWDLAVAATKLGPRVILAGGLTPGNAAEAVRKVRPYGLDVSSGVESAPGKKDPQKVRAFITAAKGVFGK